MAVVSGDQYFIWSNFNVLSVHRPPQMDLAAHISVGKGTQSFCNFSEIKTRFAYLTPEFINLELLNEVADVF